MPLSWEHPEYSQKRTEQPNSRSSDRRGERKQKLPRLQDLLHTFATLFFFRHQLFVQPLLGRLPIKSLIAHLNDLRFKGEQLIPIRQKVRKGSFQNAWISIANRSCRLNGLLRRHRFQQAILPIGQHR